MTYLIIIVVSEHQNNDGPQVVLHIKVSIDTVADQAAGENLSSLPQLLPEFNELGTIVLVFTYEPRSYSS